MQLNPEVLWSTTRHDQLGLFGVAAQDDEIVGCVLGDDTASIYDQFHMMFGTIKLDLRVEPSIRAQNLLECGLLSKDHSYKIRLTGTQFQKIVWDAISAIPRGQTKSYTEIAEYIGRPRAIRAVANACAANKLALLIPCHRVVGKATEGGYRWGSERKSKLLRFEGINNGKTN